MAEWRSVIDHVRTEDRGNPSAGNYWQQNRTRHLEQIKELYFCGTGIQRKLDDQFFTDMEIDH